MRSLGPLVLAGLRQRYAGSVLGALWGFLGPFVEVAAYVALFSLLLPPGDTRERYTFPLAVTAGLLPWASLRETLESAAGALPEHRWIRRSRVPLELLIGKLVLVASARGLVGLLLVQIAAAVGGTLPGIEAVALPLLAFALQVVACWGLALGAAPLGVLFPDSRPALASGLTLLTFASPIVYPEHLVSGPLAIALEWNPYTHLLRLFRLPLEPGVPVWSSLAVSAAFAAACLALGTLLRRRLWWSARDRL
jgi:ABC-type polysaccharide/polyol phosphate export permease